MSPYPIDGRFPTTQWSLVARAGVDSTGAQREALGGLLGKYFHALLAHLVYGKRLAREEAEDVLQEFIASKILEKNLIGRADRELGKFRTFLLTSLDRFLIDLYRTRSAKKRAPDEARLVDVGDRQQILEATAGPSDVFDVTWARCVLAQSLQSMEEECRRSGRDDVWNVFECRLLGPLLHGSEPVEYDVLVERFALKSPSQASNLLITGKRMFARALRSAVAEYASSEEEVDAEIAELRSALAGSRQ
ncbi:MAG: hypothetical protein RBS80_22070 [Thermoguttaceae bacterium]|jgi:DNA-directed RNA polymerase specialized sigma24 family protein|nr:hypothetical protein [Thermoguttaceae bacterium]